MKTRARHGRRLANRRGAMEPAPKSEGGYSFAGTMMEWLESAKVRARAEGYRAGLLDAAEIAHGEIGTEKLEAEKLGHVYSGFAAECEQAIRARLAALDRKKERTR